MFANRAILTVDRIPFALPSSPAQIKALENDHSMDAVASRLTQMGIQFRRDTPQTDAAVLGPQRMQQLRAPPVGAPFVIPENGVVTAGGITRLPPSPGPLSKTRPMT